MSEERYSSSSSQYGFHPDKRCTAAHFQILRHSLQQHTCAWYLVRLVLLQLPRNAAAAPASRYTQ